MDTITQSLLGAATAQLGFRQRLGRQATWVAAVAAALPDADSYITRLLGLTDGPNGDMAMLTHHRGISHSLLAVPVLAAAVEGVWWLVRRWVRRLRRPAGGIELHATSSKPERGPPFALLYACVFLAVLSHPLLDLCTSYGTQLLLPISSARFAIDAVPIIDVIYTPILILTLAACWVVRKRRPDQPRRSMAIGAIGLALSSAYIAVGWGIGAALVAREREAGGLAAGQVHAYPCLGSIFVWRVTENSEGQWTVRRVNVLFGFDGNGRASNSAPDDDNQWVRRARQLPKVQTYAWFARGQLRADYRRDGDVHVVEFHDMRYGMPPESVESLWPLVVTFGPDGGVAARRFRHGPRGFRIGNLLAQTLGYHIVP